MTATAVPPTWTDPVEDDALAALELVLRAQIALTDAEGDPELVGHLDRAREELEAFDRKWNKKGGTQ